MKKIGVIFGSSTYEHEISCKSVKSIIENIDTTKYDVTLIGIDKNDNWYIYNDKIIYLEDSNWINYYIKKIDNIVDTLKSFDVVFPIIHGSVGEDGKLQGMLDLFNIPYVGSNLLASAISYDKEITKIICNNYNIPQVNYASFHKNNIDIKKCEDNIGYPMIIKPANCGSSIGINIASNKKELNIAIKDALKYDNKIIIEKFINARELECSILEDKNVKASSVGEIIASNKFYDYEAKYQKESQLCIPANIDDKTSNDIKEYAKKIFNILGCKEFSRIDFLYDIDEKKIYFNEINTIPGFTTISMYPKLFEHDGISYKDLITKLIEHAKK